MVFKFNNGRGAILCDGCDKMLLSGVSPEDAPLHGEHVCRKCAEGREIERTLRLRKVS